MAGFNPLASSDFIFFSCLPAGRRRLQRAVVPDMWVLGMTPELPRIEILVYATQSVGAL